MSRGRFCREALFTSLAITSLAVQVFLSSSIIMGCLDFPAKPEFSSSLLFLPPFHHTTLPVPFDRMQTLLLFLTQIFFILHKRHGSGWVYFFMNERRSGSQIEMEWMKWDGSWHAYGMAGGRRWQQSFLILPEWGDWIATYLSDLVAADAITTFPLTSCSVWYWFWWYDLRLTVVKDSLDSGCRKRMGHKAE